VVIVKKVTIGRSRPKTTLKSLMDYHLMNSIKTSCKTKMLYSVYSCAYRIFEELFLFTSILKARLAHLKWKCDLKFRYTFKIYKFADLLNLVFEDPLLLPPPP
jgi:hypothetical protein